MTITLTDSSIAGDILNEISIAISNERTTLREIISSRVKAEVNKYNTDLNGFFKGLVQPSESERSLNGFKMKKRKPIDAEKQAYIALNAFLKNAFFVLIDDQQVDELDQELLVNNDTTINFIKLTPLIGG